MKESVYSSSENMAEISHAVLASKLYEVYSKFGKGSENSCKSDLWSGNQTETKEVLSDLSQRNLRGNMITAHRYLDGGVTIMSTKGIMKSPK